jgi:hypothetical protein
MPTVKPNLTVVLIWGQSQKDKRPLLSSYMQTKRCACLNCGHLLTACGGPKGDDPPPDEGDFTICLYCSHLMVFRRDLSVRNPTSAEIISAAGDKSILEAMEFAHAIREYSKDQNEQKKNS